MNRRTVITGMAVRVPGGGSTKEFWDLISNGRSATRIITRFDPTPYRSQVVGECDFDPQLENLTLREIRRMDRTAQLGVVCAREALTDSGLDATVLDPTRVAVSVGSAIGSPTSLEREYRILSDGGRHWEVDEAYLSPHMFDFMVPSAVVKEVAWAVGAEGPAMMVSDGCTSGMDAIGHARDLITEGSADIVVAGGTDASISPMVVACFDAIKATTPRTDEPERACRPFDRTRNGFVLAEGAAMLVLEEYEHARRRGARIYGEVAGYATRCNAYHMTGLKTDGIEMAEAVRHALDDARTDPTAVDYINAHGSGTTQNDRHETAAFKRSLGEHAYRTPVSAIKSMIGHSLGAIGAIEIVACTLALVNDVVPPTANLHDQDPECDLDYVPLTAREAELNTVLSVGSGFGGFQSAIVLHGPEKAAASC